MRSDFDSGNPPRYISLSRSRISLPSGELKGMLRLLTEIDPKTQKHKQDKMLSIKNENAKKSSLYCQMNIAV